ncbi:MAG: hypothetical protein FJW66_02025 [Actinobacteria bacterium]|nr:hypothetical protein [Actinomycetota bacterium]
MDGKQILGFLNYFILGLIFVSGLVSLTVIDQKRKLTFLFLMLLSAGLASFLFFAGTAFIIPAAVLLLFCLILFLLVNSQQYYSLGRDMDSDDFLKKQGAKPEPDIISNLAVSILFCMLVGYVFFRYSQGFYENIRLVENFNTLQMAALIEDISSNYAPLILVIICCLVASSLWFISILDSRRKKN